MDMAGFDRRIAPVLLLPPLAFPESVGDAKPVDGVELDLREDLRTAGEAGIDEFKLLVFANDALECKDAETLDPE